MPRSTGEITKIRKPRPKQTGTPVLVRLQPEQLERLERWREAANEPSRPEAIRRLLDQALKKR
jgi:Ribbon-helix-helix protein, copG family